MRGGKQVPIHDISGGMLRDMDPVRVPGKSFQNLMNMYYSKLGRLVKMPGTAAGAYAPWGPIKDIKSVNFTEGYLISAGKIVHVADLESGTDEAEYGSSAKSKIATSNYGYYHFLDSQGLMKWRYKDSTAEVYVAGIEVPPDGLVVPNKYTPEENPYRVNSKDTVNDDSSLTLNASAATGTETSRASLASGTSGGLTNPASAYDGNDSTYAKVVGTAFFYGFKAFTNTCDTLVLSVKYLYKVMDGSLTSVYISYSLNGGVTYTPLVGTGVEGTYSGTETVSLADDQDLSLVRVKVVASGVDEGNEGDGSLEPSYAYIYEAKITGSITGTAGCYLKVNMNGDNPSVVGIEQFNKIWIPIKTNNLTASRDFEVTVAELDAYGGEVVNEESVTVALDDTSTYLEAEFTSSFPICGDETKSSHITIRYADTATAESIVFHRALPWLIKDTGNTEILTTETLIYTDREPLMALGLTNALVAGIYEYVGCFEDDCGFISNPNETQRLTITDGDIGYFNVADIIDSLTSAVSADSLTYFVLGRTLVYGGVAYEVRKFSLTELNTFLSYDTPDAALFPITVDEGETLTLIPPNIILDCMAIPTGVEIATNHDIPEGLNFSENVLMEFRSRLWGLANIEDASGIERTFIRHSEVDIYEYWDPLNEVAIPDKLIDLCPLREDMALAWSSTRTYRITPDGTGFTWVKIADQGIGGVGMSMATNEAIFWYNSNGMWVFDGAQVVTVKASLSNLSIINALIAAGGTLSRCERRDQIIFHTYVDSVYGNMALVFDYRVKSFYTITLPVAISSIIELDGKSDTDIWYGATGAMYVEDTNYLDGSAVKTSLLKLKRMAARDLDRIRLYYFQLKAGETTDPVVDVPVDRDRPDTAAGILDMGVFTDPENSIDTSTSSYAIATSGSATSQGLAVHGFSVSAPGTVKVDMEVALGAEGGSDHYWTMWVEDDEGTKYGSYKSSQNTSLERTTLEVPVSAGIDLSLCYVFVASKGLGESPSVCKVYDIYFEGD